MQRTEAHVWKTAHTRMLGVEAERNELQRRLEEARKALRKYGDHKARCQYHHPQPSPMEFGVCDCGFTAALAGEQENKDADE